MRDPHETTIEGRRYRVTPLGAGKGLALFVMLTKVLAAGFENVPTLVSLFTNVPGGALADVAAKLREEDLARLCATMADATQCELKPGDGGLVPLAKHLDAIYAANYGEMFAWLRFCLVEVNYGFLGAWFEKAKAAVPDAAAPAASTAADPPA